MAAAGGRSYFHQPDVLRISVSRHHDVGADVSEAKRNRYGDAAGV